MSDERTTKVSTRASRKIVRAALKAARNHKACVGDMALAVMQLRDFVEREAQHDG